MTDTDIALLVAGLLIIAASLIQIVFDDRDDPALDAVAKQLFGEG